MRAAHTPVFKLLAGGCFEDFRTAGATHCTNGVKSTLSRQFHHQHGFMTRTFLL